MSHGTPIVMRYGSLYYSFDNADIVIATFPHGCEIAVTCPGRTFPIRPSIKNDGEVWTGSRLEAEERADKIVKHLLCEYGTSLPKHLLPNEQ